MYRDVIKPIADFCASFVLLILLAPFFIVIIIIYYLFYGGNPFYFQERIGFNQVIFRIIKFRSLITDINLPLTQRQFLLGKFLRSTSLDELPQLINILKGEMSLVGPRPLPREYKLRIPEWASVRCRVKPGLTGLAQINGRHQIPWNTKFRLDLRYIYRQGFCTDSYILYKTFIYLITPAPDVSLNERPL